MNPQRNQFAINRVILDVDVEKCHSCCQMELIDQCGTREAPAVHGAQLSPVPGQQSLTAARAEPAVGVLPWSAEQELFSGDIAVAQSPRFQIR